MDDALLGAAGRLALPTRGPAGPGEVVVRFRGGTESLLAHSDVPLAAGTLVVLVARRAPRSYDVVPWTDLDLPTPEGLQRI